MKTKHLTRGIALATITLSTLTVGIISANASMGGQGRGNGRFFSEEQRETFQNMTAEERQTFMQEKRAEMQTNGNAFGFGKRGRGDRFGKMENIDHNVEKIENGVIITITTEDEALLEKIQNREHQPLENRDNVNVQKTELSNGVQITITSDDPDVVKRIQNHKPGMGGRRGPGGGRMMGFFLTEDEREQLKDMTQEERQAFMETKKEAFENLSDEEKAALKEERKSEMEARRAQWENMTDEEKETLRAQRQENGQGFGFARGQNKRGGRMMGLFLTEDEREQLKDMTQEERQAFMETKKEAFENLSDEEKAALKEERKSEMEARRAQWENMTDEEKETLRAQRQENGQGFGRGQHQRGGRFGQGGWQNQ